MVISSMVLIGQNITIAYKTLDLRVIDSRKIKELVSPKAILTDFPDMMVVIDPEGPLIIQLGDNRIRVTSQGESTNLARLWDIAYKLHKLIKQAELVAYGFNYDFKITIQNEDCNAKIINMFLADPATVSTRLDGELISIAPRIKFSRHQVRYDLIIEPVDECNLLSHINSHHEFEGIKITPEALQKGFTGGIEYLTKALPRLLE